MAKAKQKACKTTNFVGRERELGELKALLSKKVSNLVVITGRRRVGKSRLIREFAEKRNFYSFTGLPPEDLTTSEQQKKEFARQISENFQLPQFEMNDWGDLFALLAKQVEAKQAIILLDEISWMGSEDPNFLGKLKIAWDLYFSSNPKLILILCGSVSTWIEENILCSTAFFGRISHKISLDELSIKESSLLLDTLGFKGSAMEKLMYLSIVGGIPQYLELYNPQIPLIENIKLLCFQDQGILVDEFDNIFHDLFEKRGETYKKIVNSLVKQPLEFNAIAKKANYSSGGTLSKYLQDLKDSGFIAEDKLWSFTSGKISTLTKYRLKDNYLRFYLKYIAANKGKIEKKQYEDFSLSALANWNTIMGLQFENLVLQNRNLILGELKISGMDVIMDNPFFQRATKNQEGVQIDYLIQTKFKVLYLCEIKSGQTIKKSIIKEMQEKIKKMKIPRGFAVCPVLIYAGAELDYAIEDEEYFVKIIDFNQFL